MADESIAVKVSDGVASTIEPKLAKIASSARDAHNAVEKLQSMLKSIDTSAMTKLTTAYNSVGAASVKAQTQAANLATAQAKAQAAATNSATAQQKLATASTNTASAQQKLATATANATTAQNRSAISALALQRAQNAVEAGAARAGGGLSTLTRNILAAIAAYVSFKELIERADAYTAMANKLQNVTTSQGQVIALQERLFTLANDTRSAVDATTTAFTRFDRALNILGKSQDDSLRLTETVNKALVISGATTTESASALLQLSQAFNSGRLQGDEFRAVAENMPIVLDAVAKVMNKPISQVKELGSQGKITAQVLFDAFKSIETQVDATFAKTTPTVKQAFTVLDNNFTQFIGKIDQATGLSKTLAETIISIASALKTAGDDFSNTEGQVSALIKGVGELAGMLTGVLVQAFDAVASVAVRTMELFGAEFDSTTTASKFFEGALKIAIVVMQALIVVASDVIFVFKMVGLEIVGIAEQLIALAKLDFSGFSAISDAMKLDAEKARKELDDFQAKVMKIGTPEYFADNKRAPAATNTPLRSSGRNTAGTPTDKIAEKRAAALSKVNLQLDNEISRLGMLQPLREVQQKMDQIEEQLAAKKIKLNDTEKASILSKIQAIQQQTKVQAEMDRIYQETTGPLVAYNNTLAATDKLLKAGAISQKEANGQRAAALETLQNQRDPMREANRDLQQQYDLLKMLPQQREVEQQVQQLVIDQLAKKNPLSATEVQLYRDKLTVLQQLNAVSQAEGQILADTVLKRKGFIDQLTAIKNLQANPASGFTKGDASETATKMIESLGLDPTGLQVAADANVSIIANMYSQVAQLQQANLVSEQDASNLRMQIWAKEQQGRFTTQQKFFTSLASLQSSSNKKLAAIGKAAAIANAVIDTYKSATGAYAAMASIPYVGPALGVAAAAAAVAAGMANVAQIRAQNVSGYQQGGYTGDGARNAVAGAVHGQEFVFDAPAVDRIGVQQLENIRSGRGGGSGGAMNVYIDNSVPGVEFETQQMTETDMRIIARRVVREESDSVTAGNFRNPNSKSFRSLQRTTTVQRNFVD